MSTFQFGDFASTSLWAMVIICSAQSSANAAPAGDVAKLRDVHLLLVDDMGWTGAECIGAGLRKTMSRTQIRGISLLHGVRHRR